jgi:D-arabinose 1-dehydrogenase-like Zn-dependent alcohol dehydrogenase
VGVIHQLGEAAQGYEVGERGLVGAITPCGTCFSCQSHNESQCSGYKDDWRLIGVDAMEEQLGLSRRIGATR